MKREMPIELRKDRTALHIAGTDAAKLLNDVLTGSFATANGPANWWALLSPQGKVQAEGLGAWVDDGFLLDVHQSVADAFLKRMRLYKLRADVSLESLADTHAVGWAIIDPGVGIVHADARSPELGVRVIAPIGDTGDWTHGETFAARRISQGIPELGADFVADTVFPHDMAMDLLGGIDSTKGCYIGQEVVSRMTHRGTARRRPALVSGSRLALNSAIAASGRDVGHLGQVVEGKGVAIIRLDRVKDLSAVSVNGERVALALPTWASYRFADSDPD